FPLRDRPMLALPKRLLPASAALLALLLAASPPQAQPADANPNFRFGMPAEAKADKDSREAYLIDRPQYVLSYNAKTRTPNWVAWRLRKGDIGNAACGAFQPDPLLPKGVIARVISRDYEGSGFDRGHQCPAKDRSATQADCDATFYMANVVPQSPNSNQRGWERLQDSCRRLAREGHELHIVCGPHAGGDTGKCGPAAESGRARKITVPHPLGKVAPVLPREGAEPRKNCRVTAILMPNNQSVGFDWTKYRTAAREVERLTKFRFFRNV